MDEDQKRVNGIVYSCDSREELARYIVKLEAENAELRKVVAEEIVRCRDCKHYTDHEWIFLTDVSDVCHFWGGESTKVEPDGFCKWGERRGA